MSRQNYNKYRTKGGYQNTGYGYSIHTLRQDTERESCYQCQFCENALCIKTGLYIPQLGKNSYKNCKYYPKNIQKNPAKIPLKSNTKKENQGNKPKPGSELKKPIKNKIIFHAKYGKGRIVLIEEEIVTILFRSIGRKKINWEHCIKNGLIISS